MPVLTATKENFQSEVLSSNQPVLVDFWAPWCGPCRMLSPVVEELSRELDGSVKVCKVNIDEERELAVRFDVMSIPTLLVVKDGEVVRAAAGLRPKKSIEALLEV